MSSFYFSGIISSQSCTFSYENNKTLLTEENHDHPHLHQKSVSKNTNEYSQVNCKNAQKKEFIEEKILDQKRYLLCFLFCVCICICVCVFVFYICTIYTSDCMMGKGIIFSK